MNSTVLPSFQFGMNCHLRLFRPLCPVFSFADVDTYARYLSLYALCAELLAMSLLHLQRRHRDANSETAKKFVSRWTNDYKICPVSWRFCWMAPSDNAGSEIVFSQVWRIATSFHLELGRDMLCVKWNHEIKHWWVPVILLLWAKSATYRHNQRDNLPYLPCVCVYCVI